MADNGQDNGKSWKIEIVNGLAKGGPLAIILTLVLYWAMVIANNKMDTIITQQSEIIALQKDLIREVAESNRLMRGLSYRP